MNLSCRHLMILLRAILLLFGMVAHSQAQAPLVIATDPWPPYTIAEGDNISGTDVEIIEAVFKQLDIPITIKMCPWARCLLMVQNKQVDAILDVSLTPERKEFLYFPEEPVSEGVTVFFIRKHRTFPYVDLTSLSKLRAGAMLGYSYCKEIDEAPFMAKAERVSQLEQIFNMLLRDRIDFLIEVDAVGYSVAKQMGIADQITTIPGANYCQGGNYLGFAKKPGYEQLASRFTNALQVFKRTDAYRKILANYGSPAGTHPVRTPADAPDTAPTPATTASPALTSP